MPVDVRLPVIGAKHHRVALEELVGPTGRVEERADRRVTPRQGLERLVGTVCVGREVVVREVVDEKSKPSRVTSQRPTAAA